jgi:hypothetical protein
MLLTLTLFITDTFFYRKYRFVNILEIHKPGLLNTIYIKVGNIYKTPLYLNKEIVYSHTHCTHVTPCF